MLLIVNGRRCEELDSDLEFRSIRIRMHHYMVNMTLANPFLRLMVFIKPLARHGAGNSLQDT